MRITWFRSIPEQRNLGSRDRSFNNNSPFSYSVVDLHTEEKGRAKKKRSGDKMKSTGHGNNCSHQSVSVKQLAGG